MNILNQKWQELSYLPLNYIFKEFVQLWRATVGIKWQQSSPYNTFYTFEDISVLWSSWKSQTASVKKILLGEAIIQLH